MLSLHKGKNMGWSVDRGGGGERQQGARVAVRCRGVVEEISRELCQKEGRRDIERGVAY